MSLAKRILKGFCGLHQLLKDKQSTDTMFLQVALPPQMHLARLADADDLPHLISCFTSFHDRGVCSGSTSKPPTICSVQSSKYSAAA
jgi:hypothetical protein